MCFHTLKHLYVSSALHGTTLRSDGEEPYFKNLLQQVGFCYLCWQAFVHHLTISANRVKDGSSSKMLIIAHI